jgi:hypothetical protein
MGRRIGLPTQSYLKERQMLRSDRCRFEDGLYKYELQTLDLKASDYNGSETWITLDIFTEITRAFMELEDSKEQFCDEVYRIICVVKV